MKLEKAASSGMTNLIALAVKREPMFDEQHGAQRRRLELVVHVTTWVLLYASTFFAASKISACGADWMFDLLKPHAALRPGAMLGSLAGGYLLFALSLIFGCLACLAWGRGVIQRVCAVIFDQPLAPCPLSEPRVGMFGETPC